MSLDTPDDANEVISRMKFEQERDKLWKGLSTLNNPDRNIVTKSFAIEKSEPGPHLDHTDIIESVSPDIHVVTISCDRREGAYFTMTVNSKALNNVLRIDTDDAALAGEIHRELVAKFEENREVRSSLLWLVEHSKYAQMKGKRLKALVMFSF